MRLLHTTVFSIVVITLYALMATMRPAYAYIDPGTGSYLFQTGIALVFGGIFIIRQYLGKVYVFCRMHIERNHK